MTLSLRGLNFLLVLKNFTLKFIKTVFFYKTEVQKSYVNKEKRSIIVKINQNLQKT